MSKCHFFLATLCLIDPYTLSLAPFDLIVRIRVACGKTSRVVGPCCYMLVSSLERQMKQI